MTKKKKLMVVLGAGASIDLGMPSVSDVDELFHKWSLERYNSVDSKNQSLYGYIRDEINQYYSGIGSTEKTNFEEVLYAFLQLSFVQSGKSPMGAFLDRKKELVDIMNKCWDPKKEKVNYDVPGQHCLELIDKLVNYFREKCKDPKTSKSTEFGHFRKFVEKLNSDYDVAFITLNYDNLVTQACPGLFTGFDKSGSFDASKVRERSRSNWGLIYHLHGSVHFDMQNSDKYDTHTITWNSDLNSVFSGKPPSPNYEWTLEGILPTSIFVAGYGKTNQIQREPFRTYYAQLDELVESSEAILFLGYGFNDLHINNCFRSIRGKGIPIVVVDWNPNPKSCLEHRRDTWSTRLCKTTGIYYANRDSESFKSVGEYEEVKHFTEPKSLVSIWYDGFINTCKDDSRIKDKFG